MKARHARFCLTAITAWAMAIAPHAPWSTARAGGENKTAEFAALKLTGLVLSVPSAWKKEDARRPGPMAPRAIFTIPALEGDSRTGTVRITYFPGMKGKDELNINRWLGQVGQAGGKASTRDDAKISKKEIGEVQLTIVDVSGAARTTMREKPQPNSRMIAAIVDHPRGPHFVVVAGPANLIREREKEIYRFLESAKVER